MGYEIDLKSSTNLECGCVEQHYSKSHDFFGGSTEYYTEITKCFRCNTGYAFIDDEDDKQIEQVALEPIYLFVPYEYKSDAKNLGAKFDFKNKKWYVLPDNKHKKMLIDKFHENNFITNYRSTTLKEHTTTEQDRKDHEESRNKHYLKEKKIWKKKYGTLKGFDMYCSVNNI